VECRLKNLNSWVSADVHYYTTARHEINTHIRGNEQMRDNQLLQNVSVSTFPYQRIDAVSDELFEMVISIRFASKLQKGSYSYPQISSPQSSEEFSPVQEQRQSSRQDSLEVTARAPDKTLVCV
jgi:hypothetical protein